MWSGARDIGIPSSAGTAVLVYIPNDSPFGFVLGMIKSQGDIDPRPAMLPGCSPYGSSYNIDGGQQGERAGAAGLPDVSGGMPDDAIPGDQAWMNEFGAMIGLLKVMATIKASDLAKIEAFVVDDLLNIVGHNMNIFSSLGECRVRNDHGKISLEFLATGNQNESMGIAGDVKEYGKGSAIGKEIEVDPTKPFETSNPPAGDKDGAGMGPLGDLTDADLAVGRWRMKMFVGALGDFAQMFLCSPNKHLGTLVAPEKHPDVGLFHAHLDGSGKFFIRNLAGGGFIKTSSIPVPKKRHEMDDPAGDGEIADGEIQKKEDFQFDKKHLLGMSCMLRDSFAYLFERYVPAAFLTQKKDYDLPEAGKAPFPARTMVAWDGDGSKKSTENVLDPKEFTMKMLPLPNETGGKDDPNTPESSFTQGDSWILTLPDGSISIRDRWGSSIEMRGGHITFSAAKDINLVAGRNVVAMGGNDVVLKGKESVDITATNRQVRIKGETGMMMHSENGGILISSNNDFEASPDFESEDAQGEKMRIGGIVIKSSTGSVYVSGNRVFTEASSEIVMSGRDKDVNPMLQSRLSSRLDWLDGGYNIKMADDQYAAFGPAGMSISGQITSEKDIILQGNLVASKSGIFGDQLQAKGTIAAEGDLVINGIVAGHNGASGLVATPLEPVKINVPQNSLPPLSSILSASFSEEDWEKAFHPMSKDQIDKLSFSYRDTEEYGASGGKWYETYWQREVTGLTAWEEKDIKGRFPYPGAGHFVRARSYVKYKEVCVDTDGTPKSREDLKNMKKGGEFIPSDLNEFMVHPNT